MKNLPYYIAIIMLIMSCDNKYKEYYSNGELKLSCDEKIDSIYIGKCVKFSPEGDTVFFKNFSKEGLLEGENNFYDSLGNLSEIIRYKSGLADGLYRSYYNNGIVKEKGQYKNHKAYGIFSSYDSNGNLLLKKEYFIYENESKLNQYWAYVDKKINLSKSNFILIDHLKDSIYIELQPLFNGASTVYVFDENIEKLNAYKMENRNTKIPISHTSKSSNYLGYVEEIRETTSEDEIEIRTRKIYFNLNSEGIRSFLIP